MGDALLLFLSIMLHLLFYHVFGGVVGILNFYNFSPVVIDRGWGPVMLMLLPLLFHIFSPVTIARGWGFLTPLLLVLMSLCLQIYQFKSHCYYQGQK